MTRNEFNLLYEIKKHGICNYRKMSRLSDVSIGFISQSIKEYRKNGWIDDKGITVKGEEALRPYKVNNAIIMAAGMSTRFVPLSIEKPKGLLVVKNEVLIERQIEQLQEAGIFDIVIVLGYKKEAFFYLEDKYKGIRIVINPEYNIKNNTHTLYLARNFISNSYICSSDDYFEKNPFEEYVYQSYYAAIHVDKKTNEWYMIPDQKGNIAKVEKSGNEGNIMLGHVYWDGEFSKAMLKIIEDDHDVGNYDQVLWEQVLAENIRNLPPMEIKVDPDNTIFEFDSLDELRAFDSNYVNHTHSRIIKNIATFFNCEESQILHFKAISKGLTNTSFVFEINDKKYVYRHPGDGTETFISRKHEKQALMLAKSIGVDPTFIYMNEDEGWKISEYVDGIRIPSYDSFEDSRKVLNVLRKLHKHNLSVNWKFLPWNEACKIESILRNEKEGINDLDFNSLKTAVEKCYKECENDGVTACFCHCNTYAPNWMLTDDQTILIDWEYAGNADPGCDTGTYIMDSMWEIEEAVKFIKEYCREEFNEKLLFHHLAYTAILSFYWYVWALYRESCGTVMGESLYNWRVMAKRYSKYLVNEFEL